MIDMPSPVVLGPEPESPEWFSLRMYDPKRKTDPPIVIGASEAYTACSNPLKLYLEKRGEIPQWKPEGEILERMNVGKRLESTIIDLYEESEGEIVERNIPMLISAMNPFMGATLDGLCRHPGGAPKHIIEAKNSNVRMFDDSGEDVGKFGQDRTDQVPVRYYYQGQHQMAVTGLDRVDYPVFRGGCKLQIYTLFRHDDFIHNMIAAEEELALRIHNGDPPPPNYRESSTRSLINSMYGCNVGKVQTLDEAYRNVWLQIEEIRLREKELDEKKSELTNRLLDAIGDAQFCKFPESSIQLKRIVVNDSIVTEQDVTKLKTKIGQVKRKGSVRLQRTKKG